MRWEVRGLLLKCPSMLSALAHMFRVSLVEEGEGEGEGGGGREDGGSLLPPNSPFYPVQSCLHYSMLSRSPTKDLTRFLSFLPFFVVFFSRDVRVLIPVVPNNISHPHPHPHPRARFPGYQRPDARTYVI